MIKQKNNIECIVAENFSIRWICFIWLILYLAGCPLPPGATEKVPISGSVILDNSWKLLETKDLFHPGKIRQQVCIYFEEPQEIDHTKRVYSSGIEIQVVDNADNLIDLGSPYINENMMCFEKEDDNYHDILPRDRSYKGIRIRSNPRIAIKEIAWYAHDSRITK